MDVLKLSRGFSFFLRKRFAMIAHNIALKKIENCLPNYSVSTQYFWDGDLEGSQICPHNKRSFCIFIGSLINCWNHKSHVCTIGRYSEWLWHCEAANKKLHSHRKILFHRPLMLLLIPFFLVTGKKIYFSPFFLAKVCVSLTSTAAHTGQKVDRRDLGRPILELGDQHTVHQKFKGWEGGGSSWGNLD